MWQERTAGVFGEVLQHCAGACLKMIREITATMVSLFSVFKKTFLSQSIFIYKMKTCA